MLTIFEELVSVAICSRSNLRSTGLVKNQLNLILTFKKESYKLLIVLLSYRLYLYISQRKVPDQLRPLRHWRFYNTTAISDGAIPSCAVVVVS